MSIVDLFWIFFLVSIVAPLVQRKALESRRLRTLRQIETDRGSRVVALIHRQETLSLLGFPIMRYIDIQDSEEIIRAIKLTDDSVPIDIILHTPGGLVLASEQIAHALLKHPAKVTVFIPHYAMSGGTLLALAADEIIMDENAVIGPVDPQVGQYPAASIMAAVSQKPIDKVDDETLILADISRKAMAQVSQCLENILRDRLPKTKAKKLAKDLTSGRWTHDYPITCEEAAELGLAVSTEVPEEIFQFMQLFPQPTARRPSVQYVPLPYKERPTDKR